MVNSLNTVNPPKTEAELLQRCQSVEGLSFAQLAMQVGVTIPQNPNHLKGYIGQVLELALGANGYNKSLPDFLELGIEMKTLPLSLSGKPTESTFITSIPLLTVHQQTWETSQCYAKLKRILWVPVEGEKDIPYAQRRIGRPCLWSPTAEQETILEQDWSYLSSQIAMGQLETLDSYAGDFLQVRPKAANGKSLCFAFDAEGSKFQTLPRGFYLRTKLTETISF